METGRTETIIEKNDFKESGTLVFTKSHSGKFNRKKCVIISAEFTKVKTKRNNVYVDFKKKKWF